MKKNFYSEECWSISDERVFLENLLSQRLNFFIIIYAAILTGSITTGDLVLRGIILLIGLVITCLLSLAMFRICNKVIVILTILHKTKRHPIRRVGKITERYNKKHHLSYPSPKVIGIYIPAFLTITILFGLTLTICQRLDLI